jgi:DNA replication and repair protein RecF
LEEKFFLVTGDFLKADKKINITCSVKLGQKKKLKRNKKEYEKLSEHIGQFPAVIISPYDTNLIQEGSDTRRKFIDSIISQFDKNYLNALMRYNRVLAQRNALLKQFVEMRFFNEDNIEVWDAQLVELGNEIYGKRNEFLIEFIPIIQRHFEFISGGKEEIGITYLSHLHEGEFGKQLKDAHKKDSYTGYSTVGIHKDDLQFEIDGQPIKKFGSQGQQKSFLIALRLAQFELIKTHLNIPPLLLLDDIFDKLDHHRVSQLMKLVSDGQFGQVFITDTDNERIEKVFEGIAIDKKVFEIKPERIALL